MKSLIRKLLAFLFRPPVLTTIGLVLVCAVVFFGGRVLRQRGVWSVSDATLLQVCTGILALTVIGSTFIVSQPEGGSKQWAPSRSSQP